MTPGNITKLADFFKHEYAKMINYVRSIISEAADRDSEDIVQDVIIRIFEKADISRPIEDMAAYVYRALKNRVIDILRKKTLAISIYEGDDSLSLLNIIGDLRNMPEKIYESNEITGRLYGAIDKLPDDLKSVLVMKEIEGKTFREISENTGIPAGTLMARKARALEMLREVIIDLKKYLED